MLADDQTTFAIPTKYHNIECNEKTIRTFYSLKRRELAEHRHRVREQIKGTTA